MLALVIALVGPFFVDWTSYRAAFEREASVAFGLPVQVLGSADMQILPLPHLHFETVHVGPDRTSPYLVVDEFDVRIELLPLVKGKIEIVDMTLTNPALKVRIDEQGQFNWRQDAGALWDLDMEKIRLNDVRIENGRIDFQDLSTGRQKQFTAINGSLEARSLIGPYKIETAFQSDGERYALMLSTGSAGENGMRLKSLLTPANFAVSLAMDGNVSEGLDGRYHYIGNARLTNQMEGLDEAVVPWSLNGKSDLTASELTMEAFEFSHGPVEQAYRLNGSGKVEFGADPRFDVVMSSRQLDLDRALGEGPNAPINLQEGISRLTDAMAKMPLPPMPGHLGFNVPGVILGGGIVRDVQLDANLVDTDWQIGKLIAEFPGQTDFAISGMLSRRVGTPKKHTFQGEARLSSEEPAAFAKWWLRDAPTNGRLEPFDLSGQMVVNSERFSISTLDLVMDGDRARGQVDWFFDQDGEDAAALSVRLNAERIDLDAIRGVGSLLLSNSAGKTAPLSDIELEIDTQRVATGEFEGKALSTKLRLSDGGINIDYLEVEDFAGATLSASGVLEDLTGSPRGRLDGEMQAEELKGLATIIQQLLPDISLAKWLVANQSELSPADLSFTLAGGNTADGMEGKLSGMVGGGRIELSGDLSGAIQNWTTGELSLDLALDNQKGQRLVNLLHLGDSVVTLPAITVKANLQGVLSNGADLDFSLQSSPGEFTYKGKLAFDPIGGVKSSGKALIDANDLAPYLLAFGVPLSNPGESLDANARADIEVEADKIHLKDLAGQWAGQPFAGHLMLEKTRNYRQISGQLDLGDMDGIWLGESVLGAGRLTSVDQNWLDLAFLAPLRAQETLPLKLNLDVNARSVELMAPYIFQQPAFSVSWQDARIVISSFKGLLEGGAVKGGLELENIEGEAILKTHIQLEGADISPFIWQRDGRSVATGLFDFNLDLESQGRSLAGLISGLSGIGTFSLRDGVINYVNPEAFQQVIRAVDAGLELKNADIAKTFISHMDAGSTSVAKMEAAFMIAGGALRSNNIETEAEILKSRGNLTLDLANRTLNGDWSIKVEPDVGDAVTGAQPEVGLSFTGPLDEPERIVDVAPFTGYLSIRAFEREVERVEQLQADILEKERMRRLLRLYREKTRRAEQSAIEAQEAALELKKQQQAAKELEARRKAQAALKKAQAAKAKQLEAERQKREAEKAREKTLQQKASEQAVPPKPVAPDAIEVRPLKDLPNLSSAPSAGNDADAPIVIEPASPPLPGSLTTLPKVRVQTPQGLDLQPIVPDTDNGLAPINPFDRSIFGTDPIIQLD